MGLCKKTSLGEEGKARGTRKKSSTLFPEFQKSDFKPEERKRLTSWCSIS
jgi:hypothetical protein